MGADNYRNCPACVKRAEAEKQTLEDKARAAYGKSSEGEYLRLLREAQEAPKLNETLGESIWVRVNEAGKFLAEYSCYCRECGFKFEFKHEENAMPEVQS